MINYLSKTNNKNRTFLFVISINNNYFQQSVTPAEYECYGLF